MIGMDSLPYQSHPTDLRNGTGRSPSASTCAAHQEAIELGLARGRKAMAIWQDLVDTGGFTAGYQAGVIDPCRDKLSTELPAL